MGKQYPPEVTEMLQKVKFNPIETATKEITNVGVKRVKEMIIKIIVDDKIKERVSLVEKGIKKIDSLRDEYTSIKPDIPGSYNKDLEKTEDTFSAAQGQKKVKALNDLKSLVEAMNLATEDGDFSALAKIVK